MPYINFIINKKKCIIKCKYDNIYQFEYNNSCFEQCPNGTIYRSNKKICKDIESISNDSNIADIEEKEEKISSFREDFLNGDMDDKLNNNEDYVQNENNLTLQLTTSDNQKNNSNKNISTIDLGECEDELKRIYNINETLPLIILKIDYYSNDTLIPLVGYEIYHPINKSKLNLEYCKEFLIKMNFPVIIYEGNLFKYDPNSDFYTDKCNSYTTENGTDMILNDRIKEYEDNNLSLCENKCKYINYSTENKQSICSCEIKNQMDQIYDLVNNPNKLSNEFSSNETSDSGGSSNVLAIQCAKNLFTKEGLINNISNYVLLIIIFYFLLSITFFIKCGYTLLKTDIDNIIKKKSKKEKKNITFTNKKTRKIAAPNKRIAFKIDSKSKRYNRIPKLNPNHFNRNYFIINNNIENTNITSNKLVKKKLNKANNETYLKPTFNDYEYNTLIYKDAIKFDKRTCFQYYKSLLKAKHPLIFGFCPIKDYNSIIIKSCIFFLSFSICYAINFVFFNDEVLHKIYKDEGKYDFIYFLPQICISFAATHVLTIIIKLLFLSERNIAKINFQPSLNKAYFIVENTKKYLVIKYTLFFITGIIFLSIFWLFLSAFGAVYQNTQIIVFENALISFSISFIYPIFINVIPCCLRSFSLSNKNHDLYDMSKFLQII